jgi:predicted Holliday junction resolvase-like endonuclease
MNTRYLRIVVITLMILLAAMLIHSNRMNAINKQLRDRYFDLETEYGKLLEERQVIEEWAEKLERDIDKLSEYIANEERDD